MKIASFTKKMTVAALLAGAALAGHAANTNLGAVAVGVPTSFGGFAPLGDFTDNFLFSLPDNGGSGYSVANFAPVGLGGVFNTTFAKLMLFSNPDGMLFSGDETFLTESVGTSASSLSLSFAGTSAGNYYLKVIGEANGTSGGLYTGAISVTAVPEPESYAMLLAGLGVMGAIAMRRNKRKTD